MLHGQVPGLLARAQRVLRRGRRLERVVALGTPLSLAVREELQLAERGAVQVGHRHADALSVEGIQDAAQVGGAARGAVRVREHDQIPLGDEVAHAGEGGAVTCASGCIGMQ